MPAIEITDYKGVAGSLMTAVVEDADGGEGAGRSAGTKFSVYSL